MTVVEALVIFLISFNLAQFALVWYKLGKVEQKLFDHCRKEVKVNGN